MATRKRISSCLRSHPTRRNLFGPVDHEQLQLEYKNALRKDLEDTSRRWSFDFLTEKPLKGGNFHWEVVPGTNVPLPYWPCQIQGGTQRASTAGKIRVGTSQSEKKNVPRTPEKYSGNFQNLEKTPGKGENNTLKRKQTNLTGMSPDVGEWIDRGHDIWVGLY